MKNLIKKIKNWLYWTSPAEIICIVGMVICVAIPILAWCGVIPVTIHSDSSRDVIDWNNNPANPASPIHYILFH